MGRLVVALLGLMLAACATAPSEGAPSDAAKVAQGAIALGGADAYFIPGEETDATGAVWATALHSRSGLVCRWPANGTARILIFSNRDVPVGDDVGCDMTLASRPGAVTLYATRHSFPTTAAEQLLSAASAIVQRFPSATPLADQPRVSPLWARFTAPSFLQSSFSTREPGTPEQFTTVTVAMVKRWVIKMRMTTSPQGAAQAADEAWARALYDRQRAEPIQ